MSDTIYKGQVVAWMTTRFFGYIKREDTGVEHFFHGNEVENKNEIVIGAYVEFQLGPANRLGRPLQAVHVRIVSNDLASLANEAAQ